MEITSKSNSSFKELKKIACGGSSEIFIEGFKLVKEALEADFPVRKIIIDKKNEKLLAEINKISGENIEKIYLENDLIASLYSTNSKPTSDDLVCAVSDDKKWNLNDLLDTNKNLLFFEEIQDPGNIGMIFRSALAFNIGGIVLSNNSVNPFNNKSIRTSAGAVFKVPSCRSGMDDFINNCKIKNKKLIATSSKGGKDFKLFNFTENHVFIFGNEGSGISETVLVKCNEVVKIPHSDKLESLNIAVSLGIILFKINESNEHSLRSGL